jgi:hypothetical protein
MKSVFSLRPFLDRTMPRLCGERVPTVAIDNTAYFGYKGRLQAAET